MAARLGFVRISGSSRVSTLTAHAGTMDAQVTAFIEPKRTQKEFRRLCELHDLTGFLSDDPTVRARHDETLAVLRDVAKKVGAKASRKIWDEVRDTKLRADDPRRAESTFDWDDPSGTVKKPSPGRRMNGG